MDQKNLHKCFLVKEKKIVKTKDFYFEIILGEFDQPETIWSNEMRRLMIEKIALHLGKVNIAYTLLS